MRSSVRTVSWLVPLIVVGVATVGAASDLVDLARAGDWARLLAVAQTREPQWPLRPEEALVAAHAALRLGDLETALRLHERTIAAPDLAEVAAVELAEALAAARPAEAVRLAVTPAGRGATEALRDAAASAIAVAVETGLDDADRGAVEALLARLPSPRRRQLELALAAGDADAGKARLGRLLASSPRDLVALGAAERLAPRRDLDPVEQFRVGAALFFHGRYDQAAELLEAVARRPAPGVPGSETAFLRGRCDFRRERWREAVVWYQRAADRARSNAERAEQAVHQARSLELAGDLEGAVEAARRAVQLDASDDRRLLLARLRLRRGEPELARYGLDRVKGRNARDRGRLLVAMAALRRGDGRSAERELESVSSRAWAAAAAVLRARLLLARGEPAAALDAVDRREVWRSSFWAGGARALISDLPPELSVRWREARRESGDVARWAALETEPAVLADLAARVASRPSLAAAGAAATGDRLGTRLWNLGMAASALRWDARGLGDPSPEGGLWLAERCLEQSLPWRAIPLADDAWRRLGEDLPHRVAPEAVRRSLYPAPWPEALRRAAAEGGVAPSLLAAIAREESRWQPGAVSPVGARGLTQMMPVTAARVAASAGLPTPSADQLFEPELSLRLAGVELGRLLRAFGGLEAAAVAAYNAGEAQARIWLEECGPGCDEARFAATVSFAATRAYVEGVVAARRAYGELGLDRVSE